MDKIDIKSLSKSELETRLTELGEKPYRAKQIFRWLYRVGVRSFDDMVDLPADRRRLFKTKFHITNLVTLDSLRSGMDGTAKYLFKLEDGNAIETVSLPEAGRHTICLSSQVGCRYSCAFCASAPFGFVRNLAASEMLDEVIFLKGKGASGKITNLVFMGIGEPLDNYDNLLRAIRTFNDEDAFNIGARKITVSTCGLIPGIKRLTGEGLQIELSVSLHSADDRVRSRLAPVNRRYPLKDLISCCRDYVNTTNRIITFEYILMKGVNSSREDAFRLAALLKGMRCKVNTIAYNQVKEKGYAAPPRPEIKAFVSALRSSRVNVTHRKSKGWDIDAGCGQLRASLARRPR